MVVVVVPVALPTAGAGEAAGSVEACTSIMEELSTAFVVVGVVGSVVLAAVVGAVAGCSKTEGLESGAGAGELSCARETDVAKSNAAAPQRNWLRRVDIFLWEMDDCGWCLKHEADQPGKKTVKRRCTALLRREIACWRSRGICRGHISLAGCRPSGDVSRRAEDYQLA